MRAVRHPLSEPRRAKPLLDPFDQRQAPRAAPAPARGRVLIVDDHPLFAQAVAEIVAMTHPGLGLQVSASVAQALTCLARPPPPVLVVLDLGLPDSAGCETVARMRRCAPLVPLLVVSGERDAGVVAAVRRVAGARFVPKSAAPATLVHAVRELLPPAGGAEPSGEIAGRSAIALGLSARQWQILDEMATGRSNKEIAAALQMSPETVKIHVKAILYRLGVRNRTEAVTRFLADRQRAAAGLGV